VPAFLEGKPVSRETVSFWRAESSAAPDVLMRLVDAGPWLLFAGCPEKLLDEGLVLALRYCCRRDGGPLTAVVGGRGW